MNKKIGFLCCLSFLFQTCSDIFEKDISLKEISIQAPTNNFTSFSGDLLFWWDYADGAEAYNLQVVKPGFDNPEELLIDSTLSQNKFQYHFPSGAYEWRISGVNNGNTTIWYKRSFTVLDSTHSHK